jgi:hypothetical protein
MMNWSYLCGACAIAFAVASGIAASNIAEYLVKRGVEVNRRHFTWLRRVVLRYLRQYRDLTRAETGHVGRSYYAYIVLVGGAVAFIAGALVLRLI